MRLVSFESVRRVARTRDGDAAGPDVRTRVGGMVGTEQHTTRSRAAAAAGHGRLAGVVGMGI